MCSARYRGGFSGVVSCFPGFFERVSCLVSAIYVDTDPRSHLLVNDDFVMNSGGVGQKSQKRAIHEACRCRRYTSQGRRIHRDQNHHLPEYGSR